jgi:enterochelin esterase family protein
VNLAQIGVPPSPRTGTFARMSLTEGIVQSRGGVYSRKVWWLDAATGSPTTLGIFLDGEYYVERMNAPVLIPALQEAGMLPPVTCVFVSYGDAAARHEDLICNRAFSEFVGQDVFARARERNPALADRGHLIAGPSLGGLAAAFIALSYPEVFARCLSHSGSFWWNEEWLTRKLDQFPKSQGRYWLSVGSKETNVGISHAPSGMRQDIGQLPACERFAAALQQRNHQAHFRIYDGGHDPKAWKDELPDALRWLMK